MRRHILRRDSRNKFDVYFIEAPAVGVIKIGITDNIGRRLRALECQSPAPLVLLHSFDGTARQESALHTRFLADRTHGEWFRATDVLLSLIEQLRHSTPVEIGALFRTMRTRPIPRIRLGRRRENLVVPQEHRDLLTRCGKERQRTRARRLWSAVDELFTARCAA